MMHFPRFRDLPRKMAGLEIDKRGFPVPWFVAWQDGEPVFPAMDPRKLKLAITRDLCWVCGHELGRIKAFVIGPMCAVNRTSSEPPCHVECARFSALSCPFLTKPAMGRVPLDHYGGSKENVAGEMLERNPGVTLIWQTKRYETWNDGKGGILFDIGKPHHVEWFREGRAASRAEVRESVDTGLPFLHELVTSEETLERREEAAAELRRRLGELEVLLPKA
jgi:hypothetical protein